MALTKRERELINALVDAQLRMEKTLARMAHPLAGIGTMVMHENPLNSPLIIDADDRRRIALSGGASGKRAGQRIRNVTVPKVRRKVSPYQREFGRQLKKLKKKHPRTNISTLMKKAHRATRKVRK